MDVTVTTDVAAGSARATIDGEQVGRLGFRITETPKGPRWTLFSTVVDPDLEGHGVGSALVRDVIGHADAAGATVNPTCWFVAGWLDRHPQYQHLTPAEWR